MSTSPPVFSTFEGGVYTITLNRPQRANAFDYRMARALQAALKNAARDPQIRCVLLTGAGAVFSAGQDLNEAQSVESISYREHLQKTYNPIILQIRRLEKPVLAALKGAVAGAALGIALACDMRIAAQNTQFTIGFLKVGLVPDSAVSLLLPAVIGLGKAAELAFMNTPFDAEQALAWGLVNRVVAADELESLAFQWASELAQGPVRTMGLTKRAFNKAVLPHLEQVLDYEAHLQAIAQYGNEHREGVQAFLEKRKIRFMSEA